jgi:AraC-like DNA-binding protein
MTEDRPRFALPTAMGFAAKATIAALRKREIATVSLVHRAGLSAHDLALLAGDDPINDRISAVGQAKLLDYAAEALDDTAFGIHLAEEADPRDAGIFFYAASSANNIGKALALYARYFRIVNDGLRLKLKPKPNGVAVEVEFVDLPRQIARQTVEFGIASMVKGLREAAGRNIRPAKVTFTHMRTSDLSEFERFFGCRVEFGACSDLFEFSNEALDTPLVTPEPKLLKALTTFCEMAAKERHTAAGTLRAVVENELEKLLPQGKIRKEIAAMRLGLSARTLSRRLAEEGATYEEVVHDVRRSLALQYIREPGLSLSQIAWLLGFEEPASFTHAFRRWTGRSPSAARADNRSPAGR